MGNSNAVIAYRPDFDAVAAAPTRVVIAAGVESQGSITGRTAEATAAALGQPVTIFPSHHGGFLGGEFGQQGEPEEFAAGCARSSTAAKSVSRVVTGRAAVGPLHGESTC
jgi:hypothetical protein